MVINFSYHKELTPRENYVGVKIYIHLFSIKIFLLRRHFLIGISVPVILVYKKTSFLLSQHLSLSLFSFSSIH